MLHNMHPHPVPLPCLVTFRPPTRAPLIAQPPSLQSPIRHSPTTHARPVSLHTETHRCTSHRRCRALAMPSASPPLHSLCLTSHTTSILPTPPRPHCIRPRHGHTPPPIICILVNHVPPHPHGLTRHTHTHTHITTHLHHLGTRHFPPRQPRPSPPPVREASLPRPHILHHLLYWGKTRGRKCRFRRNLYSPSLTRT